ncbi:outer membrane lipoprotein-sorting protein [Treponema primitia]|uniref:outer membrane lipoprotein-sorting protein n=1 Tax=Treponema primitia TaxID=88058 RepID=UPI00025550AD|nr:outer membrane lipoprotein-sorting protein [Treponema primitia]
MNRRNNIIFAVMLLGTAAAVFAQSGDAAAIVDKSRNRISAATISTRSRMVVSAKDGSTSNRIIDQYSKDGSKGEKRVVVEFKHSSNPANIINTRFLTIENTGGNDDQWIFLPSLGKVRRIASSEGSGSFVGTDLSYSDISSANRGPDLDIHRVLREEEYQGKPCYVIESTPKDSSYQYSKMIQWIDKANSVDYKIELYDKRGTHVKTLEILELKDVQGRLSPMVTKMSTLTEGSSTTVNVDRLEYDSAIPESVFTPRYLETGRP